MEYDANDLNRGINLVIHTNCFGSLKACIHDGVRLSCFRQDSF